MKTSSAKAKGRRLQQQVRDYFRALATTKSLGLEPEDIESRGMGQNGQDLIFSPAAKRHFPYDIECKNKETINVANEFKTHYAKYVDNKNTLKLLVHSKNHSQVLVTLLFDDFMTLVGKSSDQKTREVHSARTEEKSSHAIAQTGV